MKYQNYKTDYKEGEDCIFIKDSESRFHNEIDEPSFIWTHGLNTGAKYWYFHGRYNRIGGPALISNYRKEWWRLSNKHRLNAPAYISPTLKEWWEFNRKIK
jgi:hypothetical protein